MATKEQHRNWPGLKAFQSTPPSRVATLLAQAGRIYVFISIHTTLAGGDMEAKILGKQKMNISIHTTLAGGDRNEKFA